MSARSRRLLLHLLFAYVLPLLCLSVGYFCFYHVQIQHVLPQAESWQLMGLLLLNSVGLALAIKWKNNYLGGLYIAFLLLTLGWGTLLLIGESASYGLKT